MITIKTISYNIKFEKNNDNVSINTDGYLVIDPKIGSKILMYSIASLVSITRVFHILGGTYPKWENTEKVKVGDKDYWLKLTGCDNFKIYDNIIEVERGSQLNIINRTSYAVNQAWDEWEKDAIKKQLIGREMLPFQERQELEKDFNEAVKNIERQQ